MSHALLSRPLTTSGLFLARKQGSKLGSFGPCRDLIFNLREAAKKLYQGFEQQHHGGRKDSVGS